MTYVVLAAGCEIILVLRPPPLSQNDFREGPKRGHNSSKVKLIVCWYTGPDWYQRVLTR